MKPCKGDIISQGRKPLVAADEAPSPVRATLVPNETFIIFDVIPFQEESKLVLE